MFNNYLASPEDLKAIEEGIFFVWRKELNFIFKNKKLIKNTSIISFDSKFIYLWSQQKFSELKQEPTDLSKYHLFKTPHNISLTDIDYSVWRATVPKKEFYKYLPKFFTTQSQIIYPRIGGGPLIPFIKVHKKMKEKKEYPFDPYTTKESFLSTIVHEFAHTYFEQQYLSWYGIKSYNLNLIQSALNLYKKEKKINNPIIKIPIACQISELFAFCTEYSAALILWPAHRKNFDLFEEKKLQQSIKKEKKRNLNWETSIIDEDSHSFASIVGRIIIHKYPSTWPEYIYKHLYNTHW